ncbi:la-related protein 6B isoform X2 [Ziziphus jujuba]|uniref:La-related protein 6B isoform X2 n=1 Tax=Ziziphus jujuba TaxID=326968 RepID=A0A6P3ZKP9_ZIZJJ|nr:la-related protein 6B isoform X2 [Ziziphus jujuba]
MAQDEAPAAASSSSSSSSDPSLSLSRNVSFSRLNARAPEFVPSPRADPHTIPTPPPPPPPPPTPPFQPPPFHVPVGPIHPHVPHVIPIQNHHHPHPHPHHHHHHHPHPQHHHPHPHLQLQYQPHQHHHFYAPPGSSDQHHQQQSQGQGADPVDHSAHSSNANANSNSKSKLSDDAALKILNQVEYYFSDLNLATTDHLMRFISKDPEGFVPISVVASFKKIKALTSSHAQLATVLRNSSKLVVSEDGKKVKRQHPLTESDMEELQSRIIVAENLPEDHCHQNLMKVFSAVGSVKTIRTCQPQISNGGASSASRSAKADCMLFSNKLHAFVEYESVELAEKAAAELNDERNWRSGLRVRLMLKRTSKPIQARGKKGHDGDVQCEEDDNYTSEHLAFEKQSEDSSQHSDANSHEHLGEEHCNDKEGGQRKGRNRGRNKGRGRGQYNHNNRANHVGTPPQNNNSGSNDQAGGVAKQQPPGPRMPDGTRGFAVGRGKPVSVRITT